MLVIAALEMSLPINITIYGQQHQLNDTGCNDNNNKVVIQLLVILIKLNLLQPNQSWINMDLKQSFFITRAYTNDQKKTRHLGWNDIY